MGWTFPIGHTRKQVIDELTKDDQEPLAGGGRRLFRCLARTFKGSPWAGVLYAVLESETQAPDKAPESKRFILVAMIRRAGGEWGYKDMDESCGPYHHGCPLKYLDMVPPPGDEFSNAWRARVREYWQRKREARRLERAFAITP